jgi:hypothetical protein
MSFCAPARPSATPSAANSGAPAPHKPRYAGKVYPPAKADVELLQPVCYPCTLLPEGQPGMVRINSDAYLLYPVVSFEGDDFVVEGYRFFKGEGEPRDVRLTRWGMECDCPDAIFRRRSDGLCKHCAAVVKLREQGSLI